MKELHPGGLAMTKELLLQSQLSPCKILDMGCGSGQSVALLSHLGYDAWGIDKAPFGRKDPHILTGDFLNTAFADASFDAVLSECAFFISGNPSDAVSEARRLLKKHGLLLLADVSTDEGHVLAKILVHLGFQICSMKDITKEWKEYYLSCIWDGSVEKLCPNPPKGSCHYYLTVCERM